MGRRRAHRSTSEGPESRGSASGTRPGSAGALPRARFGTSAFEVYCYRDILDFLAANPKYDAPHYIDFYSVLLVTSGSGRHYIDDAAVPIQAGDLVCIPPGHAHQFDTSRAIEGYSLAFTEEFVCTTPVDAEVFAAFYVFHAPPLERRVRLSGAALAELVQLMEVLRAEFMAAPALARDELLRAYTKALLIKAERVKRSQITGPTRSDPGADWLRFQRILDRDCTRHRDVRHYARAVGTSAKQLGRIVRRVTGNTAKAAINDRVLLDAKRWLAGTSLSIKEIASHVGFTDATTFVKFFKHGAGETPSAFRARSR